MKLTINEVEISVPAGISLRKAALKNGIYIPGLCGHPDLPLASTVRWDAEIYQGDVKFAGECIGEAAGEVGSCGLCIVKIAGREGLFRSCEVMAEEGMIVDSMDEEVVKARRRALAKILAHHPHACLTCAQREGCSLTQCSSNVPEDERCCILLNRCELGKIVDYIGLPDETPKYIPEKLPKIDKDPFFLRDYNLCVSCLRCVRICREVRQVDVLGAVLKEGRVRVGTKNPGLLEDSYCRYCGACVEVCPTGALLDKPDSKPVRKDEHPPCTRYCPAEIDIPEYVRRISQGDYPGALEVIYSSVPFPGILGYVCFHPCEDECKRGVLDESISICALKRFVYEKVDGEDVLNPVRKKDTGKKVAIVGAGPAGLTAAFYLRIAGHLVDVYDAAEKPGGMLRYAIPQYRLPEDVLDNELEPLYLLGVNFINGKCLGKDLHITQLLENGYDAVLLAIGVNRPLELDLKGADLPQIYNALDFLRDVRKGVLKSMGSKVVVIGGGNVAVDAAMTAVRLQADEVKVICLESRDEMPAHDWEIDQMLEEGVILKNGWGPAEFLENQGRLVGVKFNRCVEVFDKEGKFNPQYDTENTIIEKADNVILAIGQVVDKSAIEDDIGFIFKGGIISIDMDSMQTKIEKLFAAGDVVRGVGSVVEAVADGRKVAERIDRYLGGNGEFVLSDYQETKNDPVIGKDTDFLKQKPLKPKQTNPFERRQNFELIEETFDTSSAQAEAYRCLRCNLRANITPVFLPPDKWKVLNDESVSSVPAVEGVYQLADMQKKILKISGTANIHTALQKELKHYEEDILFCWEQDSMYSKRESELLQRYMQEYGKMPEGDDELDDLF